MPIKAVIFDMDGLMLDTEPLYRDVFLAAAVDLNVRLTDEQYLATVGLRGEDIGALIQSWFGPSFPLEKFWERCRVHLPAIFGRGPVPLKPGLARLLDHLESRDMPRAVATSTKTERARSLLRDAGLLDRFGAMACGDEVANGKPAPDLYLLAAGRLGVDPADCLALEDADPGARAALAAGMRLAIVPDLKPPTPQTCRLAAGVFTSLDQVITLVDAKTASSPS